MGRCINHPEKETSFMCMKNNIYLCEDCLKCRDPKIHCKFRSSCPIWFMEKRGGQEIDNTPEPEKKKEYNSLIRAEKRETV